MTEVDGFPEPEADEAEVPEPEAEETAEEPAEEPAPEEPAEAAAPAEATEEPPDPVRPPSADMPDTTPASLLDALDGLHNRLRALERQSHAHE